MHAAPLRLQCELRVRVSLLPDHNLPFLHAFQHFDAILTLDAQLHIDAALRSAILNHDEVAPLETCESPPGAATAPCPSAPT